MMAEPKNIRILSIDGGGIRAILPAMVLTYLENKTVKPLYKHFDIIAGSATGGLLAAGLATPRPGKKKPYAAKDLLSFFMDNGEDIFSKNLLLKIMNISKLAEAQYDPQKFENLLEDFFKDARLSDCVKGTELLITAFNLEAQQALLFKSWKAKGRYLDPKESVGEFDFMMRDVVRATTATPSYFPPVLVDPISDPKGRTYALVNGGIVANNPTQQAFSSALKIYPAGTTFDILSLGSASCADIIPYKESKSWGPAAWMRPLFHSMVGYASSTAHEQMAQLFKSYNLGTYDRIDIAIDPKITGIKGVKSALDDASEKNIESLQKLGAKMINEHAKTIDRWVSNLSGENEI